MGKRNDDIDFIDLMNLLMGDVIYVTAAAEKGSKKIAKKAQKAAKKGVETVGRGANMVCKHAQGLLTPIPTIDKVITNGPATICFFSDGTKTVSKCSEVDNYDPVVGLSVCIAKRYFGKPSLLKEAAEKYCRKDAPDDVELTKEE